MSEKIVVDPFLDDEVTDHGLGVQSTVKIHSAVSADTEIDWSEGGLQILVLTSAGVLITFTNWAALVVAGGKAQPGTLILIGSNTYNPSWISLLRTNGNLDFTYTSDNSIILEFLNSIGGENVPYVGLQAADDVTGTYLSAEMVDDPGYADTADWTESANMEVTGGQLVLTAATAETTEEAAPLVAVAGAAYLVVTVIDEVTTAGGGVKQNVGSTDGSTHTTVGTHAEVIVATDADGLETIAAGAATTMKLGSVSVKRLY